MSFILLGILNSQVSGAAGASYELIETVNVTGSTTTDITFSGISTEYKHLELRGTIKSLKDAFDDVAFINLNNDLYGGSSVYTYHWMYGNGSSVASGGSGTTARTYMRINQFNANRVNETYHWSPIVVSLLDTGNTNKNTTIRHMVGSNYATGSGQIYLSSGSYMNTDAITKITFKSSWYLAAGSRLSLYGIRG